MTNPMTSATRTPVDVEAARKLCADEAEARHPFATMKLTSAARTLLPAALDEIERLRGELAEAKAERNAFESAWKSAIAAVDVGKEAVRMAHEAARDESNKAVGAELAAHSETRAELRDVRRRERQCMELVEKTERERDAARSALSLLTATVERVTAERDQAAARWDRARENRRAMWEAVKGLDDHARAHMAVACRLAPAGCFCGMHISQVMDIDTLAASSKEQG